MAEDKQRIYSQAMTSSQITLSLSSQNYGAENNDMLPENCNLSEDESQCYADEYDFQISSHPQQDTSNNNHETEENDSNKIEEIYEENRQLGSTIASSIENFEKCRVNLSNELMNIENQLVFHYEKHEQQLTQLLDTQMKLEEDTDTYMKELENRPLLKDKAMHNNVITNVLKEHYDTVMSTLEECKTENINLKKEVLSGTKFIEDLNEKFQNDYQNFKEEAEKLISQITNLHNDIIHERKIQVEKIEEGQLLLINTANKIEELQNELSDSTEYKSQLSTSCNTLTGEIEESKKNVAFLQEQIMNMKSTATEELHQLNVQKENQDNMLTNIMSTLETRKNELFSLSNKEKEMQGLSKQLKAGINAVSQRNNKLVEKNEEVIQKITSLNKQEEELVTQINELNYVEEHNKSLKENIDILKQSIHYKKVKAEATKEKICHSEGKLHALKNILAEKQSRVESLKTEKNKLKILFDSKAADLSMISNEIQKKKNASEVLLSELQNKSKEIHDILTKKIAELQNINENIKLLNKDKLNITQQINSMKKQIEHTEDNLEWKKKDLQFNLESYVEIIEDEKKDLDDKEEDLVDIRMELEEMSDIKAEKEALELDLQYQSKSWHEQRDKLVSGFTNTLKEKDHDMTVYKASFQGIFDMEEKKALKLSEQIRESELRKKELESELKDLFTQLKEAKENETEKRNTIVKLEKALRSVTEAAKVTQQDIKRAISSPKNIQKGASAKPVVDDDDDVSIINKERITVARKAAGKSSTPVKETTTQKKLRTGLMTPSSSLDSYVEHARNVFPTKEKQ